MPQTISISGQRPYSGKFRWITPNELFGFLNKVDDSIIARCDLGTKRELIMRLESAIKQAETLGDQNKEAGQ